MEHFETAGPMECYLCLTEVEYGSELCSDCGELLNGSTEPVEQEEPSRFFDADGQLLPEVAIEMECDEQLDELEWTLDRLFEAMAHNLRTGGSYA